MIGGDVPEGLERGTKSRETARQDVVICDDDPTYGRSLGAALEAGGHRVVAHVEEPRFCLPVLAELPIDVCLTEMMFGGRPAIEAIRSFVRVASTRTRLIVVTAGAEAATLDAVRLTGVTAVRPKPACPSEVVELLRTLSPAGLIAAPSAAVG